MFARLPDILGRNFSIGYLLPAIFFTLVNYLIDSKYSFLPKPLNYRFLKHLAVIELLAVIGLQSILIGIVLLVTNRNIIRFMEGYGNLNPFKLFCWIEKYNFNKLEKDITNVENSYNYYLEQKREVPQYIRRKYKNLVEKRVIRFPDSERLLLPTSFGNTIRAFETYSRVMYGADAIPIWTRLIAVIPENYRQLIEGAKAQVDFWVNLWLVNIILLAIYIANSTYFNQVKLYFFPVLCFILVFFSFQQATRSAVNWGNLVKSSFDLFLTDLKRKLETDKVEDIMNGNDFWHKYSQAFLYIRPDILPHKRETIIILKKEHK